MSYEVENTSNLDKMRELVAKLDSTEYTLSLRDALLAAIVENSAEAILGKDRQGFITAWNKAAVKLYGWKAEEAIGQHINMMIPEHKREEFQEILERVNRGEAVVLHETQRCDKRGRVIDVISTVSPIKDKYGTVVGASSIAHPTKWIAELEDERSGT